MDAASRLKELGLELPPAPKPFAGYRPAVRAGNLLFVAGQGPTRGQELLLQGRVPDEVSPEAAWEGARQAALNALAIAEAELGSLDQVRGVAQCTVWVRCTDDFGGQPQVADGATTLFRDLFGEAGLPARAAVGTNALPLGIPVEVAVTFLVE